MLFSKTVITSICLQLFFYWPKKNRCSHPPFVCLSVRSRLGKAPWDLLILWSVDAAPLTVDMNDKHPLENTWVIWYDSRRLHQQNPNDWFGNLQTVAIFSTVCPFPCGAGENNTPLLLEPLSCRRAFF